MKKYLFYLACTLLSIVVAVQAQKKTTYNNPSVFYASPGRIIIEDTPRVQVIDNVLVASQMQDIWEWGARPLMDTPWSKILLPGFPDTLRVKGGKP